MQQPVIATFYDHILDISRQEGCSLPEALSEAKKLGIGAAEVSFANVKGHADETAKLLSAAGMGVTAMPAFFNFGSDAGVEGQGLEVIAAAEAVGAKTLLVIPGFVPQGGDREACTLRMIDGTKRLAELAAGAGLDLTMEDFDNEAAPFSTSGELLRFIEAVPGLTACFDTGNFYFAGEDALEAYERLRGHIGHVHLKDRSEGTDFGSEQRLTLKGRRMNPSPVGAGLIPMGELLERLQAGGYHGAYTIEHYGASPMLECLRRSVSWLAPRLNLKETV